MIKTRFLFTPLTLFLFIYIFTVARKLRFRRTALVRVQAFARMVIARERYRHRYAALRRLRLMHGRSAELMQIAARLKSGSKERTASESDIRALEHALRDAALTIRVSGQPIYFWSRIRVDNAFVHKGRRVPEIFSRWCGWQPEKVYI